MESRRKGKEKEKKRKRKGKEKEKKSRRKAGEKTKKRKAPLLPPRGTTQSAGLFKRAPENAGI